MKKALLRFCGKSIGSAGHPWYNITNMCGIIESHLINNDPCHFLGAENHPSLNGIITGHDDNSRLTTIGGILTFARMDIRMRFGQKVKALRQQQGLTLEALAHKAGLDRTYLPGIEKGKRNVSILVIEKIARALNVKISSMFNDQP